MRNRTSFSVTVFLAASLAATQSHATDLSDLLRTVTDQLLQTGGHEAHFTLDPQDNPENLALVEGINAAIAGQFSTVPLGSSAGGFTATFDPATGVGSRNSNTFGPQFAERALTVGKNKWNVGFQYLHASYDNLNGTDIGNGSLTAQYLHERESFCTGRTDPFCYYEGDVMSNQFHLDLTLDTALFVGTYGVTDRFDVGLVLPVEKASLDVRSDQTLQHLATRTFDPTLHLFANMTTQQTVRGSESASGIGDIVLRGKYNFLDPTKGGGLALGLDVRVPTGDEKNFLGTGVTQGKLYLIGSWALGKIAPHFNVGYTAASGTSSVVGSFPDEINLVAGFEAECHPRVTFVFDAIGRELRDTLIPEQTNQAFVAFDPDLNGGAGALYSTTLPQIVAKRGNQTLLDGAVGVKINPGGKWLINVGALVPLSNNGLTSSVSGVVGFDYSF
jgi:Putative MetA-pathway of phenol degradation